jgi:hypothetical protein
MPSATVPGQYPTIGAIFDPPYFSLDTTFNLKSDGFLQAFSIVPIHTAESEPFLHSSEQHNGKKNAPKRASSGDVFIS